MKIKNKELIQSYILTTAKYDFSVYEKRVLYKIIERLQYLTTGKKLNYKYPIQEDMFGDVTLTFDVADFLNGEHDKNHSQVKTALKRLRDKTFEYDDGTVWEYLGIIESPSIKYYETTVSFRVTKRVFEAFLNFSKGFRKFELEMSMKFESVYAMRFYELFSNKKDPIVYSIDYLREIFGLENKYTGLNGNSNFIIKVIKPAKAELDKHSPWSFDFKYKDRSFKKEGKIHNIMFIPYEIKKNRSVELEEKNLKKQTSLRWDLPPEFIEMMKRDFDFNELEIKNNINVFIEAKKLPDFKDIYSKTKAYSRTKKNPKGYLINALKNEIENS